LAGGGFATKRGTFGKGEGDLTKRLGEAGNHPSVPWGKPVFKKRRGSSRGGKGGAMGTRQKGQLF